MFFFFVRHQKALKHYFYAIKCHPCHKNKDSDELLGILFRRYAICIQECNEHYKIQQENDIYNIIIVEALKIAYKRCTHNGLFKNYFIYEFTFFI